MINVKQCKKFCREKDLCKVEGYDIAVKSPLKYVLHHRAEIQPDGVICSKEWLQKHHVYFGRPAYELIFLEDGEHRRLHMAHYWNNDAFQSTREDAHKKLLVTKSSDASKKAMSERSKQLWSSKYEERCEAMRKGKKTTYKRAYGFTRETIAEMLGITQWKVQELHRKGGLLCLLK